MALIAARSVGTKGAQSALGPLSFQRSWTNRLVHTLSRGEKPLDIAHTRKLYTGASPLPQKDSRTISSGSQAPFFGFSRYVVALLGAVGVGAATFYSSSNSLTFPVFFNWPWKKMASSTEVASSADLIALSKALEVPVSTEASALTVAQGKDLQQTCFDTALQACKEGKWDLIESVKEPLSKLTDSEGRTLFLAAIETNEEAVVRGLAERGLVDYTATAEGNTALHIAAQTSSTSLVEYLLGHFAANTPNNTGQTPLALAIIKGNVDAVRALKAFRSDPIQVGPQKVSPSALAVLCGQPLCLDTLLQDVHEDEKQAFFQEQTSLGSILQLGVRANQLHTLEHLFQNYPEEMRKLVNTPDKDGRTPFLNASLKGSLHIMQFLKEHGADLTATDNQRYTAVHLAVIGQSPDLIPHLDYWGLSLTEGDVRPIDLLTGKTGPAVEQCRAHLINLTRRARITKKKPPDFTLYPPENLALQGGGAKIPGLAGAIQAMKDLHLLRDLQRVGGTSAGAIVAALLATGTTPEKMHELLKTMDFRKFLDFSDPSHQVWFQTREAESLFSGLRSLVSDYWQGGRALVHPIERAQEFNKKLSTFTGLCSGDFFRNWIEEQIYENTGIRNCTFEELDRLRVRDPKKFKELDVFTARVAPGRSAELICLNTRDFRYKKVIVADAIRASMSIPGVFKPAELYFKDADGIRYARQDMGKHVDGGVLFNFPITWYDDNKFDPTKKLDWGKTTNRKTLGFSFDVTTPSEQKSSTIDNPIALLTTVIYAFWETQDILIKGMDPQGRILNIPTDVGLLDLTLPPEKKEELFQNGVNAVKQALKKEQEVLAIA